jgi:hypothetical protein
LKKILILAYDFPPYVSVGVQRPYYWYKNFYRFDLKPIVITRQWDNNIENDLLYISPSNRQQTIIEENDFGLLVKTPYKPNFSNKIILKYGYSKYSLIRKVFSLLAEFFQYFTHRIGTKKNIYWGAREYIKKNEIDLILATGDPYILLKYASDLSKEFNIPWIADYRDPWYHTDLESKSFLRKYFEKRMESRINETAHRIITVSELLKNVIEEKDKSKISIIQNGYDDQLFNIVSSKENQNILNISYAGTIADFHPLESFLIALSEFKTNNPKISFKLNFIGTNKVDDIKCLIIDKIQNIKENIIFEKKVDNYELIENLKTHHILLLFNSYASSGTKIYDYLALKKKILFCYTDDQEALDLYFSKRRIGFNIELNMKYQQEILEKTNSAFFVKDRNHLQNVLKDIFSEFEKTSNISCKTEKTYSYSRSFQTEKLAQIIKECIHEQ